MLLFVPLTGVAQVVGQNTQPGNNGTFTLSVSTKLVIEAVNCKRQAGAVGQRSVGEGLHRHRGRCRTKDQLL